MALLWLLSAACQSPGDAADSGAGQDSSDGLDAGGESFAPIEPDGPPVPGEGASCEFTIDCEPLQVCVDDECVRRERVVVDGLVWGPPRHRSLDEILSRAGESLGRPWSLVIDAARPPIVQSFTVAGPAGVSLLVTVDHPSMCPIVAVGARLEGAWLDDLRCTALTVDGTNRIRAAGLDALTQHPVLVSVDDNGREVARLDLADMLDASIGAASGWGGLAGPVTSILDVGGTLFLSMRVVTSATRELPNDRNVVAFVRVEGDTATLVRVGGELLQADSEAGWLFRDDAGAPAAFLIRNVATDLEDQVPLERVALGSGDVEEWLADYALDIRPTVGRAGDARVLAWNEPMCAFSVLGGPGAAASGTLPISCPARRGVSFFPRVLDVPSNQLIAPLDHEQFGAARVSVLSELMGVRIQLFDRELGLSREESWDRPGATFENSVVSRGGITLEGLIGPFGTGSAFEWFELPMSTE